MHAEAMNLTTISKIVARKVEQKQANRLSPIQYISVHHR